MCVRETSWYYMFYKISFPRYGVSPKREYFMEYKNPEEKLMNARELCLLGGGRQKEQARLG